MICVPTTLCIYSRPHMYEFQAGQDRSLIIIPVNWAQFNIRTVAFQRNFYLKADMISVKNIFLNNINRMAYEQ